MYNITVKASVAYKQLSIMYKITVNASEAYKRLSVMYTITVKVSVAYKWLSVMYKITVKVSEAYKRLSMMYKITVKASVAYKRLPMLYKVNRDLVLSPSLKSRLQDTSTTSTTWTSLTVSPSSHAEPCMDNIPSSSEPSETGMPCPQKQLRPTLLAPLCHGSPVPNKIKSSFFVCFCFVPVDLP